MQPDFNRKLKLWLQLNRTVVIVVAITAGMIGLAIWGIASLESYPRTQLLAQTPIYLLKQTVGTFLWVFIIIKFLQGDEDTSIRKSPYQAARVDVHFEDVVGAADIKEEALDIVALLKRERNLHATGARTIRGVLMIGPPGCGKTYLAKAIATEAGIPFLSTSGSEMSDVYVGVGAKKVRDLFSQARMQAKEYGACILFIDEIDSIGKKRSFGAHADLETNKTLNQLLVEMDGISRTRSAITVIAATNAPEDMLDPALLRAGRFDRKLYYNLPTREDREALFSHFLNKTKYDAEGISIPFWAGITSYRSPADIENIVAESDIIAARKKHDRIEVEDLSEALERIELGLRRKRKVAQHEREATAYHEAGHLVAIHYLSPMQNLFKISIVFRKETLGVVHTFSREENLFREREEFMGYIEGLVGGYAGEKIKYGSTSSGVISDFQHAMLTAHSMVFRHGMGKGGHMGDYTSIPSGSMSEQLKKELNEDIEEVLSTCLRKTEQLLKKKWDLVEAFVQELLEHDELELMAIQNIIEAYEAADAHKQRGPAHGISFA